MKIVVSVLNWNQQEKTLECIKKLCQLHEQQLYICVTDNGSKAFEKTAFESIDGRIKVFRNDTNEGFAAGHLKALDFAQSIHSDILWLLNNDTEVFDDTLDNLVKAYRRYGDALYGSIGTDQNKKVHHETIWKLKQKNTQKVCSFIPYSHEEIKHIKSEQVANLLGYSLFIPISVIDKYGFIDTSFFLYFEETNYCLYLLKNGVASYLIGDSKVIHQDKGSTSHNPALQPIVEYYIYRNLYRILLNHAPKMTLFHYLRNMIARAIKGNILKIKSYDAVTKEQASGILHAFLKRNGKQVPYIPDHYLK